jgi:signal transduction histidine kinase/streptogramin lyase
MHLQAARRNEAGPQPFEGGCPPLRAGLMLPFSHVLKWLAGASWVRTFGCVGLALTGFAASTPNYITREWTSDDGLPDSRVTGVIQSHDGYLWVGTRSGLARFDGVRFTIFDSGNTPEMQSPHVTCLFEDAERTIWIGHETGELTCYQNGKFRTVPFNGSNRVRKINGVVAAPNGDIWVVNVEGELIRIKDGLVIPSPPGKTVHLLDLASKPGGGFWIQRDNEVDELEGDQLRPVHLDAPPVTRYIQGIAASRDGGLWVMTGGRMRKWKDGQWIEDLGPSPWGWNAVHNLIETKDGYLAAATSDQGLFLIISNQGVLHFCRTNKLLDNWSTSLCEDHEGNLWTGTGNSGLIRLRDGNVTTLNPPDLWQGRAILSVACGLDGALWIGTEGAGLYRFYGGSWTNFDQTAGLNHHYIWSVLPDTQGRIWAGTWGVGLFGWNGTRFEVPPELNGLDVHVPALFASPAGGLLIGTGIGLMRYEPGKITWLAREPELALPDVRAVLEAPDGTLWFGLSGGGLGLLQHGVLRQFRRGDGLSSDFVQCLHLASDGTLWIGTFNGLNRLKDGRFVGISKEQGLPNNIICAIEDDGQGNFWISSHDGILRVNQAELNRCADGQIKELHCLTYGLSDGMPTLECSGGFQPASCRTEDGRLWFPTSKGLVAVDPGKVRTNTLAPPVVIERLLVDDQVMSDGATPKFPLRIAPGRHRFEFQFTALSFAAPEKVRFRYRLDGVETEWVETQSPRKAYYSHISPGDYRFRVLACNNDGVWNEPGAMLAFTVLPEFWQTWWFRISGGVMTALAGGGIVWLDARRRMRRKLERLERQQAVERERARIARDIHDDLGAGLTRVSLLSESVSPEEVSPPRAAEVLGSIFLATREMTQAMDEIVWAVNPQHDTLDSLATYLGKFAQDFLEGTGLRCRLDMSVQLPNWRLEAEVRHNLFLAFKESLNNVLRHAGATEVRISLTTSTHAFIIIIEDNGRGLTKDSTRNSPSLSGPLTGGDGLANMHHRLQQIGGQCIIQSASGQGTRVEFQVPVNPAADAP